MSNYTPPTPFPQNEDSLLEIQKRALFKRSYNSFQVFALAARTTSTSTGVVSNPGYKGILVALRITAITLGGLKVRISTGVGGLTNTVHVDSTSLSSATSRHCGVYPGGSSSGFITIQPSVLGDSYAITVEPDTADSITYEVKACFIE